MFVNLSIKSRLVFMVAFMSVLLFAVGGWGLVNLNNAKSALKSVYENRMLVLGELEQVAALVTKNQLAVADTVSGQLAAFPEDVSVVDKRVEEIRRDMARIDQIWKNYLATELTAEEGKLAEDFATKRVRYGTQGFVPALAALGAHDFQQASEILQGSRKRRRRPRVFRSRQPASARRWLCSNCRWQPRAVLPVHLHGLDRFWRHSRRTGPPGLRLPARRWNTRRNWRPLAAATTPGKSSDPGSTSHGVGRRYGAPPTVPAPRASARIFGVHTLQLPYRQPIFQKQADCAPTGIARGRGLDAGTRSVEKIV